MGRRARKDGLPDPEQVLAGRVLPPAEQLFDLIHAVNPSGRELPEAERSAAYAQKAALQSSLIERFGELLVVEIVADGPESVVGLRHRTYQKDACHAVIEQLSPRARAWVRWQFDVGAVRSGADEAATPAPRPAVRFDAPVVRSGSVADLLRDGRSALLEFDYLAAEQAFRTALAHDEASGDPQLRLRAARALLELLVDQLCDDRAALALRAELPDSWRQDAELCGLLATAAARSMDLGAARELVAGLEGTRAELVFVELARHALAEGELDGCAELLARIPANSEVHAARQEVAAALAGQQIAMGTAMESELEAALGAGDRAVIERVARAILRLHPGSERAHAALRELHQRDEQERVARERAANEAVEALRREQEAAAIARLTTLLGAPLGAAAVGAYWDASESVREAARAAVRADLRTCAVLEWLAELGPVKAHSRCEASAAAAGALVDAEAECAAGAFRAALQRLAPHAELVGRCARGKRLLEVVQAKADEQRQQAATAALVALEREAGTDVERALRRLAELDLAALDPAGRQRAAALAERWQVELQREQIRARHAAAVECDDLLGARVAARAIAAATEGGERARWEAEVEALGPRIQEQWLEDQGTGEEIELDSFARSGSGAITACTRDGKPFAVLVQQCGARLFVRCLSPSGGTSFGAVLRPPQPLTLAGAQVEDGRLGLLTQEGLLWIDLSGFLILGLERWPREQAIAGFSQALLGPGGRSVWLVGKGPDGNRVHVIDRSSGVPRSDPLEGERLLPIWGAPEPTLVLSRLRNDWWVLDDRGAPRWGHFGGFMFHAAALVEGGGLLVICGMGRSVAAGSGSAIQAQVWSSDGQPGVALDLGLGHGPDPLVQVASSRHHGCTFVSCSFDQRGPELLALRVEPDNLKELWRVRTAHQVVLIQTQDGEHVLAQINDGEVIRVLELSAHAPRSKPCKTAPENLPDLLLGVRCEWWSLDWTRQAAAFESILRLLDNATVEARIEAWLATGPSRGELLAMQGCKLPRAAAGRVTAALLAWHGDDPEVRIERAQRLIQDGDPVAAAELLDGATGRDAEAPMRQHLHHLQALGALARGDAKTALEFCRDAQACAGGCAGLGELQVFLKALLAPLDRRPERCEGASIDSFVGRLRAGDRELARGDGRAARRWLEHPSIWAFRLPQIFARLAAAHLAETPRPGPKHFRARLALAKLLASDPSLSGVELGPLAWPAAELRRVRAAAATWLGENAPEVAEPSRPAEQPEPDPIYGGPGPFILTPTIRGGFATAPGQVHNSVADQMLLRRSEPQLERAMRALPPLRPRYRIVGLVVDPASPYAPLFRTALAALLPTTAAATDLALPIANESAMTLLAPWPKVHHAFSKSMYESGSAGLPIMLLLKSDGAAFRPMEP